MSAAVAPRSAPDRGGLLDREADHLVRVAGFAQFPTLPAGESLP